MKAVCGIFVILDPETGIQRANDLATAPPTNVKYYIKIIIRVHKIHFVSARRETPARRNRQMGRREQFDRHGGEGNGSTNVSDRQVSSRTKQT